MKIIIRVLAIVTILFCGGLLHAKALEPSKLDFEIRYRPNPHVTVHPAVWELVRMLSGLEDWKGGPPVMRLGPNGPEMVPPHIVLALGCGQEGPKTIAAFSMSQAFLVIRMYLGLASRSEFMDGYSELDRGVQAGKLWDICQGEAWVSHYVADEYRSRGRPKVRQWSARF